MIKLISVVLIFLSSGLAFGGACINRYPSKLTSSELKERVTTNSTLVFVGKAIYKDTRIIEDLESSYVKTQKTRFVIEKITKSSQTNPIRVNNEIDIVYDIRNCSCEYDFSLSKSYYIPISKSKIDGEYSILYCQFVEESETKNREQSRNNKALGYYLGLFFSFRRA